MQYNYERGVLVNYFPLFLNLNEENIFQNIFNNHNESENTYTLNTINNNHANMQKELYEKIIAEKEAHIQTLHEVLKKK